MYEYDLTGIHRDVLRKAFRQVPRVDIGIDSVIEGHMGRAFVDDPRDARAFKLQIEPFCYLAGDFCGEAAVELIRQIESYFLLMTYPKEAINIARETFGERLVRFPPPPLLWVYGSTNQLGGQGRLLLRMSKGQCQFT